MPVFAGTPESQVQAVSRTDSLDPATTCRGVTSNGRPCRRGLAESSPSSSPSKHKGRQSTDASAHYCWQHKDQAAPVPSAAPNAKPTTSQMQPRSSIDTLMDRLGVMDINDHQTDPPKFRLRKKKQKKRTLCCCFEVIEEEEPLPPRPVHHSPSRPGRAERPQSMQQVSSYPPVGRPPQQAKRNPNKPSDWVPSTLSPETSSVLLAELEKPLSDADEPGYIYIFWVTPSESSKSMPPPSDVGSKLFSKHDHRGNEALQRARDLNVLSSKPTDSHPGTLRLKIGRANNVQRRLNEWTRQCSSHLTLIRYYPYTPSSPSANTAALEAGRKVPYVHRVERLIHLELGDIKMRDMGKCEECGRQHQEWFELAAEKEAIRRVDECIRRWVKWAEMQ
ncbi:DUF1766-domain-containing protein [Aspergillus avenaceus]|uniref:DUF1766-domain-containing protein n=1 Tax=Aspergillus avenaceus TaxID=36643 RepID=A0A5N6TWP4_ASPAV|nr:DUF1766-domain-containing protein [Aspergillus avenaceus]